MLPILAYTDTDKVRSVLGLTEEDVSDTEIVNAMVETELSVDLDGWLPNHSAIYAAGTSPGASLTDRRISDQLGLYSTYFCALLVLESSVFMAAPVKVTDGSNAMERRRGDVSALSDSLRFRMMRAREGIETAVSSASAQSSPALFSVFNNPRDPVTGR